MPLFVWSAVQAAKRRWSSSANPNQTKHQWWPSTETHCPAFVASSKCSHFVNLLMFLFVLAGLMHKMSKLLDISRETLAKYIWKKNLRSQVENLLFKQSILHNWLVSKTTGTRRINWQRCHDSAVLRQETQEAILCNLILEIFRYIP